MEKSEIEHLLNLARLNLTNQEKEKIYDDLLRILDYVNQLNEVKIENIEPMAGGTHLVNVLRPDEVKFDASLSEELLNQAPKTNNDFIQVPPIFT